jgi:hypothetical protein
MKKKSTILILTILTFLVSGCQSWVNKSNLDLPLFPADPIISLHRASEVQWSISHDDKVKLQKWIIEVNRFRDECYVIGAQ